MYNTIKKRSIGVNKLLNIFRVFELDALMLYKSSCIVGATYCMLCT